MQTLIYIAKSAALMSLFFLAYEFLLKRETFFAQNRIFLLIGLITSAILPFVVFEQTVFIEAPAVSSQAISIISQPEMVTNSVTQTPSFWDTFSVWNGLLYLYLAGLLVFMVKFIIQLFSLFILLKNEGNSFRKNGITYIETDKQTGPFSFFNRVVYNPKLYGETELELILKHEKAHVQNHHNLDIILANIFAILLWFNPLAFLYRKRICQNLEFLADREATQNTDSPKAYQRSLVNVCTATSTNLPITNFHNSFIKTRILMLHQSKSHWKNSLKALLILPILGFFLMGFQVKTVAKVKPVEPLETVDPVKSVEPVEPIDPVKPADSVKSVVPAKNNPSSEKDSQTTSEISEIIIKDNYFIFNGQKLSLDDAKGSAYQINTLNVTKKSGQDVVSIQGVRLKMDDYDYLKKGRFLVIEKDKKPMLVTSSGIIYTESSSSEKTETKPKTIFSYKITKNTTKAELKAYKKELETKYDITFNYKNLNYNDEGKLIGLKLSFKDNKTKNKGGYNTQSTTPINTILFTKSDDEIGFKRTSYTNLSVDVDESERSKIRKSHVEARKEMEEKRREMAEKHKEMMNKRDSIAENTNLTRKEIAKRQKEIEEKRRAKMKLHDSLRKNMVGRRKEIEKKRQIMESMREEREKKRDSIREERQKMNGIKVKMTSWTYSYNIDKNSSDHALDAYKKAFEEKGIKCSYSGLKRNAAGEITSIKIKLDNQKGSKSSVNYKRSSEPIPTISLGVADDDTVFIKTDSNN